MPALLTTNPAVQQQLSVHADATPSTSTFHTAHPLSHKHPPHLY